MTIWLRHLLYNPGPFLRRLYSITTNKFQHYQPGVKYSNQPNLQLARSHQHQYQQGRKRKALSRHILLAFTYAAAACQCEQEPKKEDDPPRIENVIEKEEQDPCFTSFERKTPDYGGLIWEKIYEDAEVSVHRRWLPSIGVYEYRCAGSYADISPRHFVDAQMNAEYRKSWDPNVMDLEVISRREDGVEIVKWVHKFPRPLNPRVYIYERHHKQCGKILALESRVLTSAEWPTSPSDQSFVRVETYHSTLRVRAHSTFDSKGLDYVLVYHDHPKAAIPGPAYNWILNYGGPYFLKNVHAAAQHLASQGQKL